MPSIIRSGGIKKTCIFHLFVLLNTSLISWLVVCSTCIYVTFNDIYWLYTIVLGQSLRLVGFFHLQLATKGTFLLSLTQHLYHK